VDPQLHVRAPQKVAGDGLAAVEANQPEGWEPKHMVEAIPSQITAERARAVAAAALVKPADSAATEHRRELQIAI
jgi:hypothetical protein